MIVVAGYAMVKPECRAEAVEAVHKVVQATKKEAGCLVYDFYADLADPNRFHVYEEWESDGALDDHMDAAHTREFLAAIAGMGAGDSVVMRYTIAGAQRLL